MSRLLINASNLHVGGGVQVAASFLHDLSISKIQLPCSTTIYASSTVHKNLVGLGTDFRGFESYKVVDSYPSDKFKPQRANLFREFDVIFTIFGPCYVATRAKIHIVGFAQAWIIYPANEAYQLLSKIAAFRTRMKFEIQWLFFRRATHLVVELEHVKRGLVRERKCKENGITVVPNTVAPIYFEPTLWRSVDIPPMQQGTIRLGYLTRNYPHKNIPFLIRLGRELRKSSRRYCFVLTLSDAEWKQLPSEIEEYALNIGPLTLVEGPSFYSQMDGVVFPSLLESFSATPLEAMTMGVSLFASDRPFVRDCCEEHAIYIEPTDPYGAAKIIDVWFDQDMGARVDHLKRAQEFAACRPGNAERTAAYTRVIIEHLNS